MEERELSTKLYDLYINGNNISDAELPAILANLISTHGYYISKEVRAVSNTEP